MEAAPRTVRHEAHLTPEQKKRIEQAARFEGLSLTEFMVKYADETAIRSIEWHTAWAMEERDRDRFVQTFLNPPQPIADEGLPSSAAGRARSGTGKPVPHQHRCCILNGGINLTPSIRWPALTSPRGNLCAGHWGGF
ncbi:MAG: DUF1778 domain-containing protein [Terracidiphilus sp.]|jgi:uncharacterized protein (DUF1778 family)